MKLIILTLFIITYSTIYSQINMLNLNQTAYKNFQNRDYKTACIYYDSIIQIEPYFFNNFFHPYNSLVSGQKNEKENCLNLINYYSNYDSLKSARIIKPFAMYFNLQVTKDKKELKSIESDVFSKLSSLKDTTYYAGIFFIASYFKLSEVFHYTSDQKLQWLHLLEKQNEITSSNGFREVQDVKTYLQFVLNYEYYLLGTKPEKEFLDISLSESQIALIDRFGFFEVNKRFTNYFITNQNTINKIIKQQSENEQTFIYAVKLVSDFPSYKNFEWLKGIYALNQPFDDFWFTHSQTKWKELPDNERIRNYIRNKGDSAEWIILDVWATWCSPCIKELPSFVTMSEIFKNNPDWKAQFLTLSYNSNSLNEFMIENNYTFSVFEIGNTEVSDMEIRTFPSTFLIAKDGKYILLPHSDKKQEMIQVLMLKKW